MIFRFSFFNKIVLSILLFMGVVFVSTSAHAGLGASVTLAAGEPTSINPGEVTRLEITLSNNNAAAPISSLAFSNSLPGLLPDGLKIVNTVANPVTYECTNPVGPTTSAGVGTLTAVDGTQAIALANGVIPARDAGSSMDGTCTIVIPVTAESSDGSSQTYNYEIADMAVTGNDGTAVSNGGAVNQSINVLAVARPVVTKSFGSSTLSLGGDATPLTIVVSNPSPVALTNFSITDNFPQLGGDAIIQVANPANATSVCNGGGTPSTFTPVVGAGSVTATGGTVGPRVGSVNGTCTITVMVEARQTAGLYVTDFVSNTIVGATDFDNDLGLTPLNATAQVRVISPLAISKTFSNAAIASGESGTFNIIFSNNGNSNLTINSFADNPIDGIGNAAFGLKLNADPTMTCTGGGTPGTFARTTGGDANEGFTQTGNATITAGNTCTITAAFTATAQTMNVPQSFTNSIAQGAVGTVSPGIVSQPVSASILVSDELRILKSSTPANPAPGNPVRYTVTVQNWSTSVINNVETIDNFANGQTFLTGVPVLGGFDYTPTLSGAGCVGLTTVGATNDPTVEFTIGTLPARTSAFSPGSCAITFWAMTDAGAADGAPVTNVIPAGNVCHTGGTVCNGGSSNTTSRNVDADTLVVDKAFSPAGPLSENTISRMTITLTNLSANEITAASVSDPLPTANIGTGQLRIATPANAASTCGTPTITAVADSTSITMNGATIPPRANNGLGAAGTCVLQVDVVGAAGVYDNTATAGGTQTLGNGSAVPIGPVSSNTEQISYLSSLSASKFFTPGSASSGGMATVTVRMANSGSIPLTGVGLTDPLPVGMVLANPTNAYSTCAGITSFTGAPGDSSLTMSGAEIAGNGSCDVLFDVVATGSTDWVNTIPTGNIVAAGGVANQEDVVGTLVFNPPTGITVAKTTNPSTLTFPGQTSELTVTLINSTDPVTNLSFTDYFTDGGIDGAADNGMRISSTPNATTTCPGGVVTAEPNGTSFSLTGASMAASATCEVTLNVTSIVIGGITNTIPVGGIQTDQGLTNSGAATTSLTTQGNLGVLKQFTPNVIQPGERSRLRITFLNPTTQPAANISVVDTLPAGVTVPVGANPMTTCTGATTSAPATNQVSVSGANLLAASGGAAATCYSEIDVTASTGGNYTNTIPMGGVTGTIGGITVMNSEPATDILRVKSPLVINKSIGGFTLDAGDPVTFTTGTATRAAGATAPLVIALTNPNATELTQASFTDILPTGLVTAPTPSASTTCANGVVTATGSALDVRLTGATIPASDSCTMTVNVLSNITGTYTNTISAGDVTTFEGVTNAEPTQARIVIAEPPEVTKEFSPAVIPANGTSTLTIFMGNGNDVDMTLTSLFTDTLPTAPDAVVVAGTPNITKTCPGTVTAAAGSGAITYANGATIPAGGCTISVDVTAATPGVYTNNIPAGDLQTDFGNNPMPANAELTVSTLGYISGRVFRDNNVTPNGTFEASTDTVLSGISIELRSGATCTGTLLDTLTTTATGSYIFSSLAAGTYSVCQSAQPSGTTNGITTAGAIVAASGSTGTAGSSSNPTDTSSQITGIILNGDGGGGEVSGSINNNFAEVVPSSISGRVFLDENNNGVQNGADTALNGVTIELLSGGAVIDTATTDTNGDYSFTNLTPGTYTVREPTQPANTNNGMTVAGAVPNGGTSGTPTASNVTPSEIAAIILPPNTAANDNNFAEIPNGRSVTGSVFLDYNNDGTENNIDYGLAGVTLNLTGTDVNGAPVSASTTTGANGAYSFANLPEGTYTIAQSAQPTGTNNGITAAGTTGGTASNPTATTSQIINIDLTGANTLSAGNLFPEVPVSSPDLTIVKTHSPASFAAGSSTGRFTITPDNIGGADTTGTITITDTLPVGLTLADTPTGTGWSCSGNNGSSSFSCTTTNVIAMAATGNAISFPVNVDPAATGQLLTNNAAISGGGEPPGFDGNNTAMDTVGISTPATVSGTVWRDSNHDSVLDPGEELVEGWTVELLLNGDIVDTQTTAADGTYTLTAVSPGGGYDIQFRDPLGNIIGRPVPNETNTGFTQGARDNATQAVTTNAGNPAGADSATVPGTLMNLTILAGDNIIEQSLPLDPSGIVYDAVTRQPVQGAVVTIEGPPGFNAAGVVGGQTTFTTGPDGLYEFFLIPGANAPTGDYTLSITTYPGGYVPQVSTLIPPCTDILIADPAPPAVIEIHDSPLAPDIGDALQGGGTCETNSGNITPADQATSQHYFVFNINPATSSGIVNNHIPLDPINVTDIIVTKTTPIVNTSVGQLVPYTITVNNTSANNLPDLDVLDTLPPGFKYVDGSGSVDGVKLEPTVDGRTVTWENQTLNAGQTREYKLILVVGSGVQTGEYTNRAQIVGNGITISNIATATVRIVPDPVFDCSDIIGKVFDDQNTNGYQDKGEPGIANVRLATLNGLLVTTDEHGRFHVACADIPDAERGSNFLMKLDERTLPTGYRVTTENPRSVRITRGKLTKLNFGAGIHRVVRIDMQDSAFVSGQIDLKPEWLAQMKALPQQLKSGPSVVRLGYQVTGESEDLARRRLKEVVKKLKKSWKGKDCCHEIMIEEELVMPAHSTKRGSK